MSEPGAWHAADGRPGQALYECLVAAAAAPSIHNTQPWLFRPRGASIDLLTDRRRQLNVIDPDGREMLVSVGAALFNLRVAVQAHGREPRVRLMPDPAEPDLAATVSIERAAVPPEGIRALAAAIPHRHTNRRPFTDKPVPHEVLDEFDRAVSAQRATLLVADPALRDAVLSLTRTAGNLLHGDERYRAELSEWTTPGGVGRRDGVPRQAFGPRDRFGALPLRDLALGQGAPAATVAFEPDPTLILIFTAGDTPGDWLRAGAALEHVLLTATIHGLAATPLSQIMEVPRLRALLADTTSGRVVQTILRIGYPTTHVLATPRRPIAEMLLTPDDGPAT